jgi:hypothetical protein
MSPRVARFVLWGAAFAIVAIAAAIKGLELDVRLMLDYLLGSALLVLGCAAAAVFVVAIVRGFRR